MYNDDELIRKIALTLLPGVGNILAKKLIAYCGNSGAIFKEKPIFLKKIPGIGEIITESVVKNRENALKRAEAELKFIEKKKIVPLFFLDEGYPLRLKQCEDSPVMLYGKGNFDLNVKKAVSIVGTRNATDYGRKICEDLISALLKHNALIISGMAYGIDICAHKAAVKENLSTVGILAHGLDILYPSIHKKTADSMLDMGGLLTEFISGTQPDRENFPKRNRIIAGMADATIVIEAGIKGGALITAELANGYNRDVFAVPGRLGETYSEGCNHLIKINKAALLTGIKDIEYLMGWDLEKKKKTSMLVQGQLFSDFNSEEKTIVDILTANNSLSVDEICFRSNMPMNKVSANLLNLEFSGHIKSLPGKVYQLI
jgi:DNA processing protein